MSTAQRKIDRALYYAHNIFRDSLLPAFFRRRLDAILASATDYDRAGLLDRIGYYNKIARPFTEAGYTSTVSRIPMRESLYYYDLKEHARYFDRSLRMNYLFGDITWVPDRPTFVKSRPIAGDNQNSILLKLNKFRHFYFPEDPLPFRDKQAKAVWRGPPNNPKRRALVSRYAGHPLFDVGFGHRSGRSLGARPFLSPAEQMRFRYIISVEGKDVGTSLKWILASNSLCVMPQPVYETWFMEGRLEPGRHYVGVRDDFADLEEKIGYYEQRPEEAGAIIANAHQHVAQFRNGPQERLVSLLVMMKYFVQTGQIEPNAAFAALMG